MQYMRRGFSEHWLYRYPISTFRYIGGHLSVCQYGRPSNCLSSIKTSLVDNGEPGTRSLWHRDPLGYAMPFHHTDKTYLITLTYHCCLINNTNLEKSIILGA